MTLKLLKKIFVIFYIFFCVQNVNALVLTHPEHDNITVSENGIFFSGKISKHERVSINGVPIVPAKTGAFSYSVPLKTGENIFAVQIKDWLGNKSAKKYVVTRLPINRDENSDKFIESQSRYYETIKDDVVLRCTPVDQGMNRLGYLAKGTKVVVDGSFNEFSRIYLSKDNYGWAMTKDLKEIEQNEFCYIPKKLLDTEQIKTHNELTYTFTCSEDIPYSTIVENDRLILTIYNLDNPDEKYIQEFKLDKFPRYSVCMQNGILYLTFKKNPLASDYSNKNVKIIIDAGHGGNETGATGCLGHKEKDLNLDVALKLKKILEEHHFDVKMTRETNKDVSLDDRVKTAKNEDALIFISIHQNSVPISDNPNLNEGTVVFYYNPQSQKLAQEISKSVSQALSVKNEGAAQASFYVIRPTEYIGILAELVYLVNPNDVKVYKNKKFSQTAATAIYNGLSSYLHSELNNK